MCELLAVSSDRPTRLDLEWDEFSEHGSSAHGNPDGWGVGYYRGHDVACYRQPLPAAESDCFDLLGRCAPQSCIAIAHVRRAVRGAAILANCQPFAKPLGGRMHLFAHNGYVADAGDLVSGIAPSLVPVGETDSEALFGALLSELVHVWSSPAQPTIAARFRIVRDFAARMRERGALNFVYGDGELVFAHGHRRTLPGDEISRDPGLYILERGAGCQEPIDHPVMGLRDSGECARQALVATVPLNDQAWRPLGPGELICLDKGRRVAQAPG